MPRKLSGYDEETSKKVHERMKMWEKGDIPQRAKKIRDRKSEEKTERTHLRSVKRPGLAPISGESDIEETPSKVGKEEKRKDERRRPRVGSLQKIFEHESKGFRGQPLTPTTEVSEGENDTPKKPHRDRKSGSGSRDHRKKSKGSDHDIKRQGSKHVNGKSRKTSSAARKDRNVKQEITPNVEYTSSEIDEPPQSKKKLSTDHPVKDTKEKEEKSKNLQQALATDSGTSQWSSSTAPTGSEPGKPEPGSLQQEASTSRMGESLSEPSAAAVTSSTTKSEIGSRSSGSALERSTETTLKEKISPRSSPRQEASMSKVTRSPPRSSRGAIDSITKGDVEIRLRGLSEEPPKKRGSSLKKHSTSPTAKVENGKSAPSTIPQEAPTIRMVTSQRRDSRGTGSVTKEESEIRHRRLPEDEPKKRGSSLKKPSTTTTVEETGKSASPLRKTSGMRTKNAPTDESSTIRDGSISVLPQDVDRTSQQLKSRTSLPFEASQSRPSRGGHHSAIDSVKKIDESGSISKTRQEGSVSKKHESRRISKKPAGRAESHEEQEWTDREEDHEDKGSPRKNGDRKTSSRRNSTGPSPDTKSPPKKGSPQESHLEKSDGDEDGPRHGKKSGAERDIAIETGESSFSELAGSDRKTGSFTEIPLAPPDRFSTEMTRLTSMFTAMRPDEKVFLEAVKSGDVTLVQTHLRTHGVNVNATTLDGKTALRIAVDQNDEAMVAYLLSISSVQLGDALLRAAEMNKLNMVRLITDYRQGWQQDYSWLESTDYPPFSSPLLVAAIAGHLRIIEYFVVRLGILLPVPHPAECLCKELCVPSAARDSLEVSTTKLRLYTAFTNPAYYIHITPDPIYFTFKMYRKCLAMAEVDPTFRPSYKELSKNVKKFAVDLINECRTSQEVKTVLAEGSDSGPFWRHMMKNQYPRLIMAMDYNQKEFVASPTVQIVLEEAWMGDFYEWKMESPYRKVIRPFTRIALLPYIFYLRLLRPHSALTAHYALPVNKMISSLAAYILFLVLLFLMAHKQRRKYRKAIGVASLEFVIFVFVFSMTVSVARQVFVMHPRRFFSDGWNIYDVVTLTIFWLTAAFWMAANAHYILLKSSPVKNIERKYWNEMDPELVADGFFVVACIMAFLKLLFFFQISYDVGPMQVALNLMVKDCAKYSLFIVLIILSYTIALGKFYSYYEGMAYKNPETGKKTKQEDSFSLFWGIFGMSGYSLADVVISNVKKAPDSNETYMNEHDFTEFIGYLAFGSYTILMGIVVINMLIGTMASTFADVLGNIDTEWMFGRTQVYIYYMTSSILPPPLNIIPQFPYRPPVRDRLSLIEDSDHGLIKKKLYEKIPYRDLIRELVQRHLYKRKLEK